ncbi:hypothetical protein LEP1GSC172_3233 [Leptospira noguchii]|uniref:Uncharacterized protein n=2 Tax=Leptospira noguchii TaxID=28182 RepID=T0GYK4_9LEPT|nr:hypothetical protein LEP1GSC172_3233 [Leptospira noguchii]EQA72406.1 hypothetical protein LEP1GSC059_3735 [Leptospira noguchii serovar Panama str. CZ214]
MGNYDKTHVKSYKIDIISRNYRIYFITTKSKKIKFCMKL